MADFPQDIIPDPTLSLDPSILPTTLSLDTADYRPALNSDVALNRAIKTQYGLGDVLQTPLPNLYQGFVNGGEDQIRLQAANVIEYQNAAAKQALIQNYANSTDKPLDPDVTRALLNPTLGPVDPRSILERGFATKYMSGTDSLNSTGGNTLMDKADQDMPQRTDDIIQLGADFVAKNEILRNVLQDVQERYQGQSWLGWGYDLIKSFIPGYQSIQLSGNTPGVSYAEGWGLLGQNMKAQADKAWELPVDQFRDHFQTVAKNLTPGMALAYLTAAQGQSTVDRWLNNSIPILDAIGVGQAAKGSIGLVKGLMRVNEVRVAVRDMANAAKAIPLSVTDATEINKVLAVGAGDLGEAGVQTVVSAINRNVKGAASARPLQDAMETLPSGMRMDDLSIAANPGYLGGDMAARIIESSKNVMADLMETVMNMTRVNRIPEALASSRVIRALKDEIRGNYKGQANTLLDISKPYYDSISNTHFFEAKIGSETGDLFASRDQAIAHADLNGIVLKQDATSLQTEIDYVKNELKGSLPHMEDDTTGLNHYYQMQERLNLLQGKQRNLYSGNTGATVEQQGAGFYISKIEPLKENSSIIRDFLQNTPKNKLPQGFTKWLNATVGWIRTPGETLTHLENQQRVIATHGPAYLLSFVKRSSKEIEKIQTGKYWDNWTRAIDASTDAIDANGLKGSFFNNPKELEDFYQRSFDRLPAADEIAAYFAFKRNVEVKRVLDTISQYRNKARVGVKQYSYHVTDASGARASSPFVEGIMQNHLPGGEADSVLVPGDLQGKESVFRVGNITLRKQLEDDVKTGKLQVIRIIDPQRRQFEGFLGSHPNADARIRYIISNRFEEKPLSYENQVPRTGSGHFEVDYEHYIKQANVRQETVHGQDPLKPSIRMWYDGDTTIMPILKHLGPAIVDHLNNVRKLIKADDLTGAEAYNNAHLPMKWEDHHSWYRPQVDPETGYMGHPMLNKDEEIQMVPKNKLILDQPGNGLKEKYGDLFKDGTKSSDMHQYARDDRGGPQDLRTIVDKGTAGNPLYAYEPSRTIDPVVAMNRGFNQIVNSMYMDDMKIFSVEHWLAQASKFLETDQDAIRLSPFYYFNNPEYIKGISPADKSILESARYKIKQFVGVPGKVDAFLHAAGQDLVDSIYGKRGPVGALIPTKLLPLARNPLAFIRTMTYHTSMGIFAIPQLFTQLTTYTNILAIGGLKHAPAATMATLMHQWSRMNMAPEIIDHMDQLATRMKIPGASQWKPGEFKEAMQALKESGFQHIGGEHALRDTPMWNQVVGKDGVTGRFLHWGETPFREGATNTRIAAYYTAYREFREGAFQGKTAYNFVTGKGVNIERPGRSLGALTREDKAAILQRASDLDHNMSRAYNSMLQTGIMAPLGQFLAYPLRLMELMTGKRLSVSEKARLFAYSSVIYGMPIGGVGLFGFPMGDWMKQKAEEEGYVVGKNFWTVFNEGLPSAMIGMITGNYLNISKWGSKGFDPIAEAMDTDKTLWSIFGGASFGKLGSWWKDSSPFRSAVYAMIHMDPASYPLKLQDVVNALGAKEISSVNSWWRTYDAIDTGRFMSKTGSYIDDVSPFNAVLNSITGLEKTKIADLTLSESSEKAKKDRESAALSKFMEQQNYYYRAMANGDIEQAQDYYRRGQSELITAGYPEEKIVEAYRLARLAQEQTLVDRIDFTMTNRNVSPDQAATQHQRYQDILATKGQ